MKDRSAPLTEYVSTRWYRAPELMLKQTNYSQSIDIFALGCIMAELYLGRPLFPGRTESEQLMTIVTVLGTPTQIEWPEGHQIARAKGITFPNVMKQNAIQELLEPAGANLQAINLLQQMLKFDSNRRITASSALRHNFFNNVPPIPKDDKSVSTF